MFAIYEKLTTLEHRREPRRQSDRVHQPLADGDQLQSRRAVGAVLRAASNPAGRKSPFRKILSGVDRYLGGLGVMAERDTHRGSRASVPVHKIDFTRRRSFVGVPVVTRAPFGIFPRLEVAQFLQLFLVLGLRIVFLFCHLSIPVINPSLSGILLNDRSAYQRLEIVRLPDQEGRSRAKSCAARSLWSSQGKYSAGGNFLFCAGALLVAKEE